MIIIIELAREERNTRDKKRKENDESLGSAAAFFRYIYVHISAAGCILIRNIPVGALHGIIVN